MPAPESHTLLAIDVGNSRLKLGRFDRLGGPAGGASSGNEDSLSECVEAAQAKLLPMTTPPSAKLPLEEPTATLSISPPTAGSDELTKLDDWLTGQAMAAMKVVVASVCRPGESLITAAITQFAAASDLPCEVIRLTADQLPLEVRLPEPEKVGIDRLLAAVAANRLRRSDRAAIVVDLGTAITVDLIAPDGAFEGGAILPGIAMSARALHEQTDALPTHPLAELDASPDAVGKATAAAIEAGLFWGAVGAVRELIARQSDRLTNPPQVFLTGGAAPSVARLLGGPELTIRYVPHLVLSGIAEVSRG